jgi:hypothetical protein
VKGDRLLEATKGDRSFILGDRSCWKKSEGRSLLWEKRRSAIALVGKN